MSIQARQGSLYVVATPIGHLDDITIRAVEVLKKVPIIAAEDTRHSRVLLDHIDAHPGKLVALHDHNEIKRAPWLIEECKQGRDVAIISDAGTPLLSDPGFRLVRLCREERITVVPVPGCSALTAVLSVSSIPVDRFHFQGFLPAKSKQRRNCLNALVRMECSLIFYEAPHRMKDTIRDLAELVQPSRRLLIARELTKIHETIEVGTVAELAERFSESSPKGEFVCILEGSAVVDEGVNDDVRKLLKALSDELPATQAARLAAKISGLRRSRLYDFLTREEF